MLNKTKNMLMDFWVSSTVKERIELYAIPIVLTIVFTLILFFNKQIDICKKIEDFTNTLITISSLLAAFGLATATIIMTSSGKNIEDSKQQNTDRKKSNGTKISYFHLLLIRNFYNILIQVGLLMFAIIIKILIYFGIVINVMIIFEVLILLHSIFVLVLVIMSMYHLMWPTN